LFFYFFSLLRLLPTPPYTLSLHDALPIFCTSSSCWCRPARGRVGNACHTPRDVLAVDDALAGPPLRDRAGDGAARVRLLLRGPQDRKSTRLNSSHVAISYAVFCLKKKKEK